MTKAIRSLEYARSEHPSALSRKDAAEGWQEELRRLASRQELSRQQARKNRQGVRVFRG